MTRMAISRPVWWPVASRPTPSAGQPVQGGGLFRYVNRVVLGQQQHSGRQANGVGDRRGNTQRDQGIEPVAIAGEGHLAVRQKG